MITLSQEGSRPTQCSSPRGLPRERFKLPPLPPAPRLAWQFKTTRQDQYGEVEVVDGKPEWLCNECRFEKKDLAQWTIEGPRHINRHSVVSQGHYEKPNPLKNATKNIE